MKKQNIMLSVTSPTSPRSVTSSFSKQAPLLIPYSHVLQNGSSILFLQCSPSIKTLTALLFCPYCYWFPCHTRTSRQRDASRNGEPRLSYFKARGCWPGSCSFLTSWEWGPTVLLLRWIFHHYIFIVCSLDLVHVTLNVMGKKWHSTWSPFEPGSPLSPWKYNNKHQNSLVTFLSLTVPQEAVWWIITSSFNVMLTAPC